MRVSLILAASWVLKYWQFEVAGALYLLWLVYQHFMSGTGEDGEAGGPQI